MEFDENGFRDEEGVLLPDPFALGLSIQANGTRGDTISEWQHHGETTVLSTPYHGICAVFANSAGIGY